MLRACSLLTLIAACCSLAGCYMYGHPSAVHTTGMITGKVIDASGRPVSDARVTAVYARGWMFVLLPTDGDFVLAETVTRKDGTFRLESDKRVDQLHANSKDYHMLGYLYAVRPSGNVIRMHQ